MDIFEQNKLNIDKRISSGLDLIRKSYELKEVDTGSFEHIIIKNMDYIVSQYEIKGVGNLVVMKCKDYEALQMDTFVVTPYYKNLPLFSTDYIYTREKRVFLNEIYNLIDDENELYNKYIKEFIRIKDKYNYFTDMPLKVCWYDNIRPVVIAKNAGIKDDDEIIKIFIKNLEIFIKMEKASPVLDEKQYKAKLQKTQDYVDRLINEGGVSTDVFKAVLGNSKTTEFFNTVFFAPALYNNLI